MAVKTRFLLAEALFEMAKDHRKLEQTDWPTRKSAAANACWRKRCANYPDTSLAAQGEFLLANLAQELDHYQEAIAGMLT